MRGAFFQPYKFLLVIAMAGLFLTTPSRMFGQATPPSSDKPQKNWKDRAEYDLYNSIAMDTNMKTRLDKLKQWEMMYPMTDYAQERRILFMTTYLALGDAKNATEAAKAVLMEDPNNFVALYAIVSSTQALAGANPSPEVLDQSAKAANALLAMNTPPPNVTEAQWNQQKPQIQDLAYTTLGWIEMQRKNWQASEADFQKSLAINPNNGQVDFWLGSDIANEKDVAKMPSALFYFARAATYDGQGSLNAAGRQQVMQYVQKAYKGFHGSDADFNQLIAAAKASPNPPAGFTIKNAVDIAQAEQANEEQWAKDHPQEALWKNIKMTLSGADGGNYFNSSMKDAKLPTLKGKVIKLDPETKPKELQLALDDGSGNTTMADATLKFEMPLPGKVDAGTELTFEGVPESYTASPFMVVFNVDKDDLHGWTGKNAPPVHRPAKKKTSAQN